MRTAEQGKSCVKKSASHKCEAAVRRLPDGVCLGRGPVDRLQSSTPQNSVPKHQTQSDLEPPQESECTHSSSNLVTKTCRLQSKTKQPRDVTAARYQVHSPVWQSGDVGGKHQDALSVLRHSSRQPLLHLMTPTQIVAGAGIQVHIVMLHHIILGHFYI